MNHTIISHSKREFLKKAVLLSGAGLTAGFPVDKTRFRNNPDNISVSNMSQDYWNTIRGRFHLTRNRIYFNAGTLGPSPKSVTDAVHKSMIDLETISETGHAAFNRIRKKAVSLFGCGMEELAFTRSTTEGINIIARGLPLESGDEILMSSHEHPGGAQPWMALAKEKGLRIRVFDPVGTASENLDVIRKNLTSKTSVLFVSHITCTTGLVFPTVPLSELCRARNIFFVLDGAHGPGMIDLKLNESGCDFYAASGHKWLLGPKGTGFLYVRSEMQKQWNPVYAGAYSDSEYSLEDIKFSFLKEARAVEYGTRSTELVEGTGAAIDFISDIGRDRFYNRSRGLVEYLRKGLSEIDRVSVLTPGEPDSYGSIVTFRPRRGKHDYISLDQALSEKHSIRLRRIHEAGLNAIRVSPHIYNSFKEIDVLLDALKTELY